MSKSIRLSLTSQCRRLKLLGGARAMACSPVPKVGGAAAPSAPPVPTPISLDQLSKLLCPISSFLWFQKCFSKFLMEFSMSVCLFGSRARGHRSDAQPVHRHRPINDRTPVVVTFSVGQLLQLTSSRRAMLYHEPVLKSPTRSNHEPLLSEERQLPALPAQLPPLRPGHAYYAQLSK